AVLRPSTARKNIVPGCCISCSMIFLVKLSLMYRIMLSGSLYSSNVSRKVLIPRATSASMSLALQVRTEMPSFMMVRFIGRELGQEKFHFNVRSLIGAVDRYFVEAEFPVQGEGRYKYLV